MTLALCLALAAGSPAGMMAGHPNDANPLNLRNVAFDRNRIAGDRTSTGR